MSQSKTSPPPQCGGGPGRGVHELVRDLLTLLALLLALPALAQTAPPPPASPASLPSPGFTQDRQFTNARLWLLDTGSFAIEQAYAGDFGTPRATGNLTDQSDQLLQTELEYGILPHLELDLYANFDFAPNGSGNYTFAPAGRTGPGAELRVAIGDHWGQFWGNPVLDFELWGQVYLSTRLDARLLLADTLLSSRLLWTVNLMFARNSFHDDVTGADYEIKANLGLSVEVFPDILHLGAEATLGWDSHNQIDPASDATVAYPDAQLGPVIVLSAPHHRFKLTAALLFGLADWDPPWAAQVVAGTTF